MTRLPLPEHPLPEHPLRQRLNDELHARPPMALGDGEWISYLAVLHDGSAASAEEAHLHRLCGALGTNVCPLIQGDHWVLEAGDLRLKWERHNEFSSYTFFLRRNFGDALDSNALAALPMDWLGGLPGTLIAATHVELRPAGDSPLAEVQAEAIRCGDSVVASSVADGAAWVVSDFRLHQGFTRFVVLDDGMTRRQAGRTVQRLLEIETYRMMALLAFPVAKEVSAFLSGAEEELAGLMDRMGAARNPEDERDILASLTRVAADVERSVARTAFRFGAAQAYFDLVRQRIADLRESRLGGFPPIQEFMDRRLAPAINTCASAARRQLQLSDRVARKSSLLRTRVEMELERQNQELLAQMNKRAKLQLRLQETVEGLSVVVLTYYGSSLVHHLAEGLHEGLHVGPAPVVSTALSIPLIAALVAWGTHRMRRKLTAEAGGH